MTGLHVAANVATGLVAGSFLLGSIGLSPAVNQLAEPIQIRIRQAMIPRFRALLLPMMLLAVLATGLFAWRTTTASRILAWTAFALTCVLPLLTVIVNVPVNNQILDWPADAPPTGWQRQIARWDTADRARLLLSLGAFVFAELS